MKLKHKITSSVLAIIVSLVSITILSVYYANKSSALELGRVTNEKKSSLARDIVNNQIKSASQILNNYNVMGDNIDFNYTSLSKTAKELVIRIKNNNPDINNVGFVLKDGTVFRQSQEYKEIKINTSEREYYKAHFIENKDKHISSPYVNSSGAYVFTISKKITDSNGVTVGILYIGYTFDYFNELLKDTKGAENIEIFTNTGIVISSKSYETGSNILSRYPEYKQLLSESSSLMVENENYDSAWLISSVKMDSVDWTVANWVYLDDILEDTYSLIWVIATISSLLSIVVILFSIYAINRTVLIPLGGEPEYIESLVFDIANGILSKNMPISGKETGIYASVLTLNKKLFGVIDASLSISDSVTSSSEELTAVMNNTASNTQDELVQIEGISTAICELSSTSKEVSSNAIDAETEARKAIENIQIGNKTLAQSTALIKEINESVQNTATMVKDLQTSTMNIGEVTDVINSISEQTNLLALNAAIEAARAGEYGRGFAVVADEVRVLASKTQESTKNIQQIIATLQTESEEANKNMISNVSSIQESVELSELVKASFDDISHSVQSISDINSLVATASQEQYSVTEDIAKNTTRTLDLVNENMAAINQTQQAAHDLATLAEKQNQELSFFKQKN